MTTPTIIKIVFEFADSGSFSEGLPRNARLDIIYFIIGIKQNCLFCVFKAQTFCLMQKRLKSLISR